MYPSLPHLQMLLVAEMGSRNPYRSRVEELEQTILHHPDLRKQATQHVRNNITRRDIYAQAFDPNHRPGILCIVRIPKGTKVRITYSPDNKDYVQSLYWYLGILLPITESHLCTYTHAYRQKRGIVSEINQILSAVIRGYDHQVVIGQEDVESCFDHAPIALILHLLPPWTAGQVKMLQQRFRETVISSGKRPQGGPQGHPAICALVNLTLDHILRPIRQRYEGRAILCNFSDDFVIVGSGNDVREMRKDAKAALSAQGVTLNPDKSRTTRVAPGSKVVILGLELEWVSSPQPIVRPKRQAYRNLSDKVAEGIHNKHIQAIIRSWRAHYNGLCNDPDHERRTQEAVNKGLRRHSDGNPQPPRPDFGGI